MVNKKLLDDLLDKYELSVWDIKTYHKFSDLIDEYEKKNGERNRET